MLNRGAQIRLTLKALDFKQKKNERGRLIFFWCMNFFLFTNNKKKTIKK